MNKILFKLFGSKNVWLQKRLVKSIFEFNKMYPKEYTCPMVNWGWGTAGKAWYQQKMREYTGIDVSSDSVPFTTLAKRNKTCAAFERARFLYLLNKDFEL